jgi:hypothetical protein
VLHVGQDFQHDLGFVRRRDVVTMFGRYARVFRPGNTAGLVREYSVGLDVESTRDAAFTSDLTRVGSVTYAMVFRDSATVKASVTSTTEQLLGAFTVGNSHLRIVPGEYAFDTVSAEFASNPSTALSGGAEFTAGEYWTGRRHLLGANLRWRFNAHLAVSATVSHNDITLPEGPFTATLAGLRLDWSLTPRMFLNAYVQRNTETDTWLTNVRFNLIHRPLSDIYLVWNDTTFNGATGRALLLKYTHLVAF